MSRNCLPVHRLPARIAVLFAACAARYDVAANDIRGPSQSKRCVAARREAARALHSWGLSFPEIGRYISRHHTAAIALVHKDGRVTPAVIDSTPVPVPDLSGEWAI